MVDFLKYQAQINPGVFNQIGSNIMQGRQMRQQAEENAQDRAIRMMQLQAQLANQAYQRNKPMVVGDYVYDPSTQQFTGAPGAGAPDAEKTFDQELKLADRYTKEVEPLRQVGQAYVGITDSLGSATPTAASDIAGVFQFLKALDPNSTVREGEYASAQNTTGVPGYVMNLYNQAVDGKILNAKQRQEFIGQAEKMKNRAEQRWERKNTRYKTIAEKRNLDFETITGGGGFLPESQMNVGAQPTDALSQGAAQLGYERGPDGKWYPKQTTVAAGP